MSICLFTEVDRNFFGHDIHKTQKGEEGWMSIVTLEYILVYL